MNPTKADLTEHQIQACVMKRATGNPAKAQLEMMPDEGKQDSPRLAWMKRHGIRMVPTDEPVLGDFAATDGCSTIYGESEDDALAALAEYDGIPLWNEEEFKK